MVPIGGKRISEEAKLLQDGVTSTFLEILKPVIKNVKVEIWVVVLMADLPTWIYMDVPVELYLYICLHF